MQRSFGMTGAVGLDRSTKTAEYLDDAHGAAAAGAWFAQGKRSGLCFGLWRGGLFSTLGAEQGADLRDVCFACRTGQQAVMPDAMDPVGQDMH